MADDDHDDDHDDVEMIYKLHIDISKGNQITNHQSEVQI